LARALALAAVGAFGTLTLSACDEWAQDSQNQDQQQQQQQPQRQQDEQPPAPPVPQP
jgi:hemolysin activation/secretion protein